MLEPSGKTLEAVYCMTPFFFASEVHTVKAVIS
jgi:hypothetical protein